MAPARLTKTTNELVVVCVEKEQPRIVGTYHIVDRGGRVAERIGTPNVERDCGVLDPGTRECGNGSSEHDGRKVLDAVKAQVLERFNCLTLPCAGKTSDEDQTRQTHMKPFSPERANALLPKLTPLVEELLAKRRDLAIRLLESDPALHHVEQQYSPRLAAARSPFPPPRFGDLKLEIHRLIHRIESLGCIVKDIDLGLIDFPAIRAGEAIYLCWKAGEPAVLHWHGTDEGFSLRRPL